MRNSPDISLKEASEHGNVFLPLRVYHPVVNASQHLFLHWHREMEISLVRSGTAHYTINFQEYQVHAGDVIIIAPGCLHSGRPAPGVESQNVTLVFDVSMLLSSALDAVSSKFILPIVNEGVTIGAFIPDATSNHSDLVTAILRVADEYQAKQASYELFIKSELMRILALLFRAKIIHRHGAKSAPTGDQQQIKNAIIYIQEHHAADLYVRDIAKHLSYSEYHLSRMFKHTTGLTCVDYICKYRIQRAAQLLIESSDSVTKTAFEVGFNNVSHFIRKFKDTYDMTPGEYRMRYHASRSASSH